MPRVINYIHVFSRVMRLIRLHVLRSQACSVAGVALGWRWVAQRAGSLDSGSFLLFQSIHGENTIPRAALCVPRSRGERKAGLPVATVTARMVPGRRCRGSPGWPRGCCQAAASVPGAQQTLRGGRTSREMLNGRRGPGGILPQGCGASGWQHPGCSHWHPGAQHRAGLACSAARVDGR